MKNKKVKGDKIKSTKRYFKEVSTGKKIAVKGTFEIKKYLEDVAFEPITKFEFQTKSEYAEFVHNIGTIKKTVKPNKEVVVQIINYPNHFKRNKKRRISSKKLASCNKGLIFRSGIFTPKETKSKTSGWNFGGKEGAFKSTEVEYMLKISSWSHGTLANKLNVNRNPVKNRKVVIKGKETVVYTEYFPNCILFIPEGTDFELTMNHELFGVGEGEYRMRVEDTPIEHKVAHTQITWVTLEKGKKPKKRTKKIKHLNDKGVKTFDTKKARRLRRGKKNEKKSN